MAKEKKVPQPTQKQYAEKVCINMDFEQAIKALAVHANTVGTKKITYNNRNSPQQ